MSQKVEGFACDPSWEGGSASSGRLPAGSDPSESLSLPVMNPPPSGAIRPSRMSRRRAWSLVIVHVLMIVHIAHWLLTGRTLSPVEPSEAMYTLNHGYLNAGFLFFAVALLATLLLGRFVCGWGCHLVAYQDVCAWLMKRIGVHPKPFRSRLLVLAPFALAVYMFVWPSAYRWWMGIDRPVLTDHLMKTEFWETFPGPVMAVVTVLVCGFVMVYFLGSKGFCTYACPYGGFFRLAEKTAPGRIRVTDACEHCGHCTARCTSNVRVHEEVALYGMVVDPGCMKCMDCISVCPNDALYFGFGKPSLGATPKAPRRAVAYDFPLWQEGLMAVVGVAALLSFRGLYDRIPLLLAMAIAGITAYVAVKLVRLVGRANVRLQNRQLKRGGRITPSGRVFVVTALMLMLLTVHSAAVQYDSWRGHALFQALAVGDEVWSAQSQWWQRASTEKRSKVEAAMAYLEGADRWGLLATPTGLQDLVWLYLAKNRNDDAEKTLRRLIALSPDEPDPYRGLAGVMRKVGRLQEAERFYHKALTLRPSFDSARNELAEMLVSMGRPEDAIVLYRDAVSVSPNDSHWRLELGKLLLEMGRFDEGVGELRTVIEQDPEQADAQYALGYALLRKQRTEDALSHLAKAAALRPTVALYQYNLAVATFMAGRPAAALPHIREAIRLNPDDPDAYGFLAVVLRELGDTASAEKAAMDGKRLRNLQEP